MFTEVLRYLHILIIGLFGMATYYTVSIYEDVNHLEEFSIATREAPA